MRQTLIKPGTYTDEDETAGVLSFGPQKGYASTAGYREMFTYVLYTIGVSRHHLAFLLGVDPPVVYMWTRPNPPKDKERRPSSKYLLRLLKLLELHHRGVPLAMIKEIDWVTGEAHEREVAFDAKASRKEGAKRRDASGVEIRAPLGLAIGG